MMTVVVVLCASFWGFEILTRGKRLTGLALDGPPLPDVFVKGTGLYGTRLNPESPLARSRAWSMCSARSTSSGSRSKERAARFAKNLADYREQADKPFEHEGRLKTLLARQTRLNVALDLDKNKRQIVPSVEDDIEPERDIVTQAVPPPRQRSSSSPAMGL